VVIPRAENQFLSQLNAQQLASSVIAISDETQMTTKAFEELYEDLLSMGDRAKTIRQVNSNVLLLPLESFWKLLHTSPKELWEVARARNPSLPVSKTMEKMLTSPARLPGRSAMIRLIRAYPAIVSVEARRFHDAEYIWPVGLAWHGLFSGGLFQNKTAKAFWVQFVRDATVLNAETLPQDRGIENICRCYAGSPLVARFGCTALRSRYAPVTTQKDDNDASVEQVISSFLQADVFTVLLRILAWYVADIVVENFWDVIEREHMSELIPFECVIPIYEPISEGWSNPMLGALEHLGNLCDWQQKQKVTTYLGNLWANRSGLGAVDGPARIKLLRYWVQAKKGRPKFQTFLDLVCTVTKESPRLKGTTPDERAYDTWVQASVLRLGETLALVRLHLTHIGLTHVEVESVMSVYAQEYRFARTALGRPMLSSD